MNKNPRSVFLFPEGTRSLDGKVGRFKKGGLKLAIDLGVPIVPVGIVGTKQFQSNLKKGHSDNLPFLIYLFSVKVFFDFSVLNS